MITPSRTIYTTNQYTHLREHTFENNIPALEQALNEGADVNMVHDETGWTLLMCAAKHGNIEALQFLIDSKASTDIKDKDAKTALDIAQKDASTSPSRIECAGLLVAAGLQGKGNGRIHLQLLPLPAGLTR